MLFRHKDSVMPILMSSIAAGFHYARSLIIILLVHQIEASITVPVVSQLPSNLISLMPDIAFCQST